MNKFYSLLLSFIIFISLSVPAKSQIVVSDTADAWDLIRTLVGSGVTVTSPTLVCPTLASGTFSGSTTLGINKGVVLTTGIVVSAIDIFGDFIPGVDVRADSNANVNNGGPSDASLDSIAGAFGTFNSCALTFNFIPIDSYFTFKYVFASEEYPEYCCTPFNDAFAFFISGPGYTGTTNLALVPGTSIPVTINSINANDPMIDTFPNLNDTSYCRSMGPGSPFPLFYRDNTSGLEISYDGMTTILTVSGKVAPCSNYMMKIAIADVGDENLDSGVFLEENSFSSGAAIHANSITDTSTNMVYEGCTNGRIRIQLPVARTTSQTLSLSYGGDAISGVDYNALPSSIIIPGGKDTASIFVNIIADGIIENDDTIMIYINNPCTLLPYDSTMLIIHNFTPDTLTYNLCTGDSVMAGGRMRGSVGFYTDIVVNSLGCNTSVITHIASVSDSIAINLNQSICQGDSLFFNNNWRKIAGTFRDTFISISGCDSFVILNLLVNPIITTNINNSICSGDSITIAGRRIGTAGIYFDTLTATTGCDSIMRITLSIKPISTSSRSITICPEDSAFLGGSWRDLAGTYYDTLINYLSCDSIITSTLSLYLAKSDTATTTICIGDSLLINGTYRNTTGYYPTIYNDVHGCDSSYYIHLLIQNAILSNQNMTICQNDSIQIFGNWTHLAGSYNDTTISSAGCDSIHTINLSLRNTTFPRTLHICPYDSILVAGSFTSTAGIYYDSLTSTVFSCDSLVITTLIVDTLPVITIKSNDTTICAGSSVSIGVISSGSYSWSNGSTTNVITVNPTSNQTYYVTVTNSSSCYITDSIHISINPVPTIPFQNTYTICYGQNITIQLPGEYNYLWNDLNTDSTRTFAPTNTSNYSVDVINSFGCSTTYFTTINVYLSDVKININPDDTITLGTIVNLEAVSLNTQDSIITWIPLNNPLDSHARNIVINPTTSGYYTVISTNSLGCIYVDSVWVFVLQPDSIAIPTAFSPNGDGINDYFRPFYSNYLKLLQFKIFNRWGELVYDIQSDSYSNKGWDGTFRGREQGLNSFVYYFEAINIINGEKRYRSGNVTLLR